MKMYQKGQALVALLIFIMVGITVTIAASYIIAANSVATGKVEMGLSAKALADSGAEDALIRLLRNPGYMGENIIEVEDADITVSVTSAGENRTIISEAKTGNFSKKVEVVSEFVDNKLRVVSWKEVD